MRRDGRDCGRDLLLRLRSQAVARGRGSGGTDGVLTLGLLCVFDCLGDAVVCEVAASFDCDTDGAGRVGGAGGGGNGGGGFSNFATSALTSDNSWVCSLFRVSALASAAFTELCKVSSRADNATPPERLNRACSRVLAHRQVHANRAKCCGDQGDRHEQRQNRNRPQHRCCSDA